MFEKNYRFVYIILSLIIVVLLTNGILALPNGANANIVNSTTANPDSAGNASAMAGNVTSLNIYGVSTTQSWQGYSGNVSGAIKLADGSDNVLYNWSVASPSGEVYASTNTTIQWSYIQCLNFSSLGNYSDDTAQAGATSLYGTNLTQLQNQYGINLNDTDSVNNTFIAASHTTFYTGSQQFSSTECKSMNVFDNTGASVAGKFQEVLLYEPNTRSVVFTSLLEKDLSGYDQKSHDFEMLVLEDGHNGNVAVTPYYFFVELQ